VKAGFASFCFTFKISASIFPFPSQARFFSRQIDQALHRQIQLAKFGMHGQRPLLAHIAVHFQASAFNRI